MLWLGLMLVGCGDDAADACNSLCDGQSGDCLAEFGLQSEDCFDSCQAQVDQVGEKCMSAIAATLECLGTCDPEELSEADLLACQDEAFAVADRCEPVN